MLYKRTDYSSEGAQFFLPMLYEVLKPLYEDIKKVFKKQLGRTLQSCKKTETHFLRMFLYRFVNLHDKEPTDGYRWCEARMETILIAQRKRHLKQRQEELFGPAIKDGRNARRSGGANVITLVSTKVRKEDPAATKLMMQELWKQNREKQRRKKENIIGGLGCKVRLSNMEQGKSQKQQVAAREEEDQRKLKNLLGCKVRRKRPKTE